MSRLWKILVVENHCNAHREIFAAQGQKYEMIKVISVYLISLNEVLKLHNTSYNLLFVVHIRYDDKIKLKRLESLEMRSKFFYRYIF